MVSVSVIGETVFGSVGFLLLFPYMKFSVVSVYTIFTKMQDFQNIIGLSEGVAIFKKVLGKF